MVEKDKFEWNNFAAWTSVWVQFSFCRRSNFSWRNNRCDNLFFIDKVKQWPPTCQTTRMWSTMSTTWILDVSEPVPQLANTRTRWSWLTMKNVKSKSSEVPQWRQAMRSQIPRRSRRWSTSWETMWPSFPSQWRSLKQWSRKQVGQSSVSQETSGQQKAGNKQSASQHYRIVPINLCGTYPRITRQFVTISSWWQRCFNNTMSSAMWPSANAMYSRGDTASQCSRSWLATTMCWQSRSWTIPRFSTTRATMYYNWPKDGLGQMDTCGRMQCPSMWTMPWTPMTRTMRTLCWQPWHKGFTMVGIMLWENSPKQSGNA